MRELRHVGIGLVLGVCLVLAMGQAPAPQNAGAARYRVTSAQGVAGGNVEFFITDEQAGKVYYRVIGGHQMKLDGLTIEEILKSR